MATVRLRETTFRELVAAAGRLQAREGRPLSLDEAVARLLRRRPSPSAFAGAWRMSDREEADLLRNLQTQWRRWRPPG